MSRYRISALRLLVVLSLGSLSIAINDVTTVTTSAPQTSDAKFDMNSTPMPTTKKFDVSYVTAEKWFCGAGDYDKTLSHQMSEADCPLRMYETNLCCLAHDLCYMEEGKTQEDCDSAFCFCLDRTVREATVTLNSTHAGGCGGVSSTFCLLVQMFGSSAHKSAKSLTSSTTIATTIITTTTVSSMSTATTTETTATKMSTTQLTTKSPAEIAQFITHNVSLQCFDYGLSYCVEQMHTCMRLQSAENQRLLNEPRLSRLSSSIQSAIRTETEASAVSACSAQFCTCASSAFYRGQLSDSNVKSCSTGLKLVCNEMIKTDASSKTDDRLNIHFWTINMEYPSQDFNSVTIILGVICIFLVMATLFYSVRRIYRWKHQSNSARLPTIARPPDFGFSSWQRRQKHDSKSGYSSFMDKMKSDASENSVGTSKESPIVKQHLHAPHRSHHHVIPMSSSKAQLINADENSSSSASTPSINSNE